MRSLTSACSAAASSPFGRKLSQKATSKRSSIGLLLALVAELVELLDRLLQRLLVGGDDVGDEGVVHLAGEALGGAALHDLRLDHAHHVGSCADPCPSSPASGCRSAAARAAFVPPGRACYHESMRFYHKLVILGLFALARPALAQPAAPPVPADQDVDDEVAGRAAAACRRPTRTRRCSAQARARSSTATWARTRFRTKSGQGFCYEQGAHFHEYPPFDQNLFRE